MPFMIIESMIKISFNLRLLVNFIANMGDISRPTSAAIATAATLLTRWALLTTASIVRRVYSASIALVFVIGLVYHVIGYPNNGIR